MAHDDPKTTPALHVRPVRAADARAICAIYNPYIADTVITFEETPVSPETIVERIAHVAGAGLPWLVAAREGELLGYAYAGPFRERSAYRFTVETTVYLAREQVGQGIGRTLYAALLRQLRPLGLHSAIGGIALPNAASVALHERLGFQQVACLPQVGWKLERWIDVGYWQLRL